MAVLNVLKKAGLLDGAAETVTGKTIGDVCKKYAVKNPDIIREYKKPRV
jgi:dihydroxyacid dehydratase/phosphogluconate dehydratase